MIYNDLALFTAVAQQLSFSGAAGRTGVPLSRVSRRIAGLEARLGVRLFERTTRQVRLTEEGRRLLDRCQGPIEALRDVDGISESPGRQTIRVTAPPLAVRTTIGPRLLAFAQENADISIDLTSTTTMLDFFRDNIDLAFRLGPLRDSSLVARRLWPVPYCFCAGHDFIAHNGLQDSITIQQLRTLPALVSRQPWLLESGETIQPRQVRHQIDDLDLLAAAAGQDMGIAMLPRDMAVGRLQPLRVDEGAPVKRDMFAVYPSRRLLPARVRKLIDFMGDGPTAR